MPLQELIDMDELDELFLGDIDEQRGPQLAEELVVAQHPPKKEHTGAAPYATLFICSTLSLTLRVRRNNSTGTRESQLYTTASTATRKSEEGANEGSPGSPTFPCHLRRAAHAGRTPRPD